MRRIVITGSGALRRIGLLIGAVAFLLQLTVWSVNAPAVAAGSVIPLCTADGLRMLPVGPDGQPGPEKADHGAMGCPLCPVMQGLSVPPPAVAPDTPCEILRHGPAALPGERIAAGWFLSTLQARAPPAAG